MALGTPQAIKVPAAGKSATEDKVLSKTDFREFALKEKTVLSHNTAMYVAPCPHINSH